MTYAGVTAEGFNSYAVGADSVYYDNQGGSRYRSPTLFERNGVTEFQGPFYELYTKKRELESPGTFISEIDR